MEIGINLKNLRTAKGMTQKDLANTLNVSSQAISRWENDEVEPDIATLSKLSEIFGVSVDELINGKAEPKEEAKTDSDPIVIVKEAEPKAQIVGTCHDCGKSLLSNEPIRHLNKTFPDGHTEKSTLCLDCYASRIDKQNKSEVVPVKKESKQIAVCHNCGAIIHEDDKYEKGFSRRHSVFYCENCAKKREENRAKQIAASKARASKAEKVSIVLGIIFGVLALVLGCIFLPKAVGTGGGIGLSILLCYGVFTTFYCLITGSYILDVFASVASVSIKFPGLIFSWDIDGFVWVITMKIAFAILGFLFGLGCAVFAVALSMALSIVSWPFIFIHNRKYGLD